jgi:hypothetical protein
MNTTSLTPLYQENPPFYKSTGHKAKSWTDSIEGYLNEASKLTQCLVRNRKALKSRYTWFVTICVEKVMAPLDVNAWWRKAARNLERHGVVASWVREPTRTNSVHYHLILRSSHDERDLASIIERSLPSRQIAPWHRNIERIKGNDWHLLHYISKAKLAGKTEKGTVLSDLYRDKRLLFQPNLGIRKVGTIGKFWITSKSAIWNDIKAHEQKVTNGLAVGGIKRLAKHVHEFFGGTVSLKQIERCLAINADAEGIQQWLSRI